MTRLSRSWKRGAVSLVAVVALGLTLGYGVAQSTVVTQAEWAVYMAQGLGLDWNLPPNAKSNHYLARLDWTKSVDFQAAQMVAGSTATPREDGSIEAGPNGPAEAMYNVSMLRAGDYGFRVKLSGGAAVLKLAEQTFELYQPASAPRWVDLDRVPLSPGAHPVSLMLSSGTRAESIGVTPPCMIPVEPSGGWKPLEPLRFAEMAVTIAKALDLEQELPAQGDPFTIRGEQFVRTLEFPYDETMATTENEPFWLSSGGSIVTAVARFKVSEAGIYSLEARYISPNPLRWNMDSCLRVITCPVLPSQLKKRSLALELEPGEHTLEVTLPPGAKLDRVEVQRRDGSTQAYLDVVSDDGFKIGKAEADVLRRDALAAARKLRDRFQKLSAQRCSDSLVAMESLARAISLQSARADSQPPTANGNAPGASAGPTQTPVTDALFPPVASPVQPH